MRTPTDQAMRVGLDGRFLCQEQVHPHSALLRELLRHNARQGHPWIYLVFGHAPGLPADCQAKNVNEILVPTTGLGERFDYFFCFEPAVLLKHVHLFLSPYYRYPLLARILGAKTMHMIHECGHLTIDPQLLPVRFRSWFKRLQILAGFSIYAWLASRTITVSVFSAREIRRVLGIPFRKILVIPNCLVGQDIAQSDYGLAWQPYLLFVGSNQPKKNLDGLLDAWQWLRRDYPELRLVVRARLTPAQHMRMHADIGSGVVELSDYLPDDELHALLGHAEALVLPSFHEGFGLPVIEALAAGTPVCVSSDGAMAEVAGPAGYFFDPSDPASIANACLKVLERRPRHDPLWREQCRSQVSRYHSDFVIQQFTREIKGVLNLPESCP